MRKNFCILFLLSAAASLLTGCRQCRPVEVERIEHVRSVDTLERLCWRFDSIVVHDSVFAEKRGDTLFIDRTKFRYRDRLRVDTVTNVKYLDRTLTETQVVEVPRPLSFLQRFLMGAGFVAIAAALMAGGLALRRLFRLRG